jgi:GGDEF domain-containing protein
MCSAAQDLVNQQHFEAEADTATDVSASLGCIKSRSGAPQPTVTYSISTLRRACTDLDDFGQGHDQFGPEEDDIALEDVAQLTARLDCSRFNDY